MTFLEIALFLLLVLSQVVWLRVVRSINRAHTHIWGDWEQGTNTLTLPSGRSIANANVQERSCILCLYRESELIRVKM